METLNAFQVFFDEKSKKNCTQGFKLYDNTDKLTVFFENKIIANLIEEKEHEKAQWFGVFSHDVLQTDAFSKKSREGYPFNYQNLSNYLAKNDNLDVVSFWRSGYVGVTNFVKRSEKWHTGFVKTFQLILKKIDFKVNIDKDTKFFIMQNHFVAKTHVWNDYYNNLLKPAMDVMSNDSELIELCKVNANYKPHEDKSHLKRQTGFDYYTMHTFLCERFISTFLNERNYNCKHW